MEEDFRGDIDHHDGTSDATPGGYAHQRRPGEAAFAGLMVLGSAVLLWNAYGISGFEALSGPGSVPMATTLVMLICAIITFVHVLRVEPVEDESFFEDILPVTVIVLLVLLTGFGLALTSLGFLPAAALFLIISIKFLSRRSWPFTLTVALGSLALIWLIFRIVFTVLLPAGIVPEAEFIQLLRNLFANGGA